MARFLARALARTACAALVVQLVLAGSAGAQGWHQDARYGFKLMPPKGWKPIPLKADENWLVAKFMCDVKDRWTDGKGGWTWEHQPELMVIAFVEEAIQKASKKADEKEQEGKKEGGGEDDEEVVVFKPYKDYEDYLDRTYQGGGFYVAEREEGVSNELPVTKLEIKVEKLTYSGPKRIVTWVFHAEGVDFAVQTEVLEHEYPKHKATIQSVLRSFRPIPRTMGPLPTDARTDDGIFISLSSMKRGSPEERKQKRLESELQIHTQAKKTLPAGWQVKEHERFLILYDTEAAFAEKVAENCAGLLAWAEENLGFIGQDEYVRRPILRVCASDEEMRSLQRGVRNTGSWSFDSGNELVTCKDEYGASGWQMEWVNRRLLDVWLRERDFEIWFGMPEWVQHGLYEYVEGARIASRKLQFKDYRDEFDSFRRIVQRKQHMPVRELVQMTSAQFFDRQNDYSGAWNRMSQADMVVRFLLSSEAARVKQTKTLLFDYLENLRDVVVELQAQDEHGEKGEDGAQDDKASKEPTTEEEEEALYKKKHEDWESSEREKEVVKRTFQRSFGSWSSADWEAFEKAFLKYAN